MYCIVFLGCQRGLPSAASRCILVPFERHGRPNKCAQKVPVILFPCIFHMKTKWNIVYKYLKTKIFSRDTNILPQMHWTSNIFGHSATTIGGFWISLNYPILNFKKTVCPKNKGHSSSPSLSQYTSRAGRRGVETMSVVYKFRSSRPEVLCKK